MRLKEDDSNYNASSVKRRDFRHDAGLPETEIPKHRKLHRRKKGRHVHDWSQSKYMRTKILWGGVKREVFGRRCKKCGHYQSNEYGFWW